MCHLPFTSPDALPLSLWKQGHSTRFMRQTSCIQLGFDLTGLEFLGFNFILFPSVHAEM